MGDDPERVFSQRSPRHRGCASEDVRHGTYLPRYRGYSPGVTDVTLHPDHSGMCLILTETETKTPRRRGYSVELRPASVGMCQTNSRSWLFAPSSGMCLESPRLTKLPRKCGDVPPEAGPTPLPRACGDVPPPLNVRSGGGFFTPRMRGCAGFQSQ